MKQHPPFIYTRVHYTASHYTYNDITKLKRPICHSGKSFSRNVKPATSDLSFGNFSMVGECFREVMLLFMSMSNFIIQHMSSARSMFVFFLMGDTRSLSLTLKNLRQSERLFFGLLCFRMQDNSNWLLKVQVPVPAKASWG